MSTVCHQQNHLYFQSLIRIHCSCSVLNLAFPWSLDKLSNLLMCTWLIKPESGFQTSACCFQSEPGAMPYCLFPQRSLLNFPTPFRLYRNSMPFRKNMIQYKFFFLKFHFKIPLHLCPYSPTINTTRISNTLCLKCGISYSPPSWSQ